jgi:tetratricopeptide (TPR) repeat protein
MFATGSMVLLGTSLGPESNDGNARPQRMLINQGCDLIDKLVLGSGREPQIGELVTCRLERARGREELKEIAEARSQYAEAIELASRRHARTARSDAALRLIEARQAYAEFLVRQGQSAEAEGEYGKLLDDSRRLGSIHNHRREFAVAEGEALGQLGDLTDDRGETLNAAERYEAAAEAVRRALKPQGEKQDSQIIGWLARLYRLSGERRMRLGDQDRALASLRQCAEVRRLAPEAAPPAVEHENALVQALILQLERQRGNSQAAELARSEALAAIARITADPKATAELKKWAADLKIWIGHLTVGD